MKPIQRSSAPTPSVAKARIPVAPFTALAFDNIKVSARSPNARGLKPAVAPVALFVSDDIGFFDGLWRLAAADRRTILHASSLTGAIHQISTGEFAATLLDLDMPAHAGWVAAEWFLQYVPALPAILLTARNDHYEIGAAIRAGLAVDKTAGPAHLLAAVGALLEKPPPTRLARSVRQQVLIRQAKPLNWVTDGGAGYHHCGIND